MITLPTNWETFRNLDTRRYPHTAACPSCGGKDRLQIYTEAGRGCTYPHIWCRQCGALTFLDGAQHEPEKYRRRVQPEQFLDESIARRWHDAITPAAIAYFRGRGISHKVMELYALGWKSPWQRYSIPTYSLSRSGSRCLSGIQYRASRDCEHRERYLSEPGSHKALLGASDISGRKLSFILVVEGGLDALALLSTGYPAVAAVAGNTYGGWEPHWNKWLKGSDVILIPDNDEPGDLIALSRLTDIPHSRIWRLPAEYKDVGDLIQQDLATAGERLKEWLHLPPIMEGA
jgi:Zn ribbon nucleic-acid-binding protein